MDLYDFMVYFTNKYNLRVHIIYNDDDDIVDKFSNRTIFTYDYTKTPIDKEQADEMCDILYKHFTSHYDVDIFRIFSMDASPEEYLEYMDFTNLSFDISTINKIKQLYDKPAKFINLSTWHEIVKLYLTKYGKDYDYDVEALFEMLESGKKTTFSGPYKELCETTKMEFGPNTVGDFSCFAYRTHMAYGNGFAYGCIFITCGSIARLLNLLKYDVKKVWIYKDDPEVLLISGYVHFLTTFNQLAKDIKLSVTTVKDIAKNNLNTKQIEQLLNSLKNNE